MRSATTKQSTSDYQFVYSSQCKVCTNLHRVLRLLDGSGIATVVGEQIVYHPGFVVDVV